MIPYYLLYAYLSLNSLLSKKVFFLTGTLTFLILLIFIGLRHEIELIGSVCEYDV